MRILYVTGDWKWTGPAEPMLSAASGLRAHGHRVELAFPVAPDGVAGALDARARERDLDPVLRLERRRGFLPLRDRDEVRRLRALLVEGRHAVVHAYHTRAHLLALFAARGLATRVVTTWTHGEPLPRAPWRRLRLAPRWTDGLVVLSEGIAASARGIGWPPDRVAIVPGVVDTERFRPREASEELRAALGIDPGERVLGVVARIQPHRRFGLLLEALERTRRVAPGLRLLVVGRGTRAREVLEEPVRARGLERQVVRSGYRREDYRDVLALMSALVFLVPGSDGSCRAVLEAMAMGIPTIATRRGILPEIVCDGETGRLVDEAPEGLAEAMLEVWRDPEAWALRGKAARARAVGRYTVEAQAERLERFYAGLPGAS